MESLKFMVFVRCKTFNHAQYIEDALNGFCKQITSFPFVCTIIDDASTDGEQEVINKYLSNHFDLDNAEITRNEETNDYYLTFAQHKSNKNCFFAVYLLKYNHYKIKKTKNPYLKEWSDKSKYLAICEGDDYWISENKIQQQVDFLENHPDFSMSHSRYTIFYEKDNVFDNDNYRNEQCKLLNNDGEVNPEKIINGYNIRTLTVLYRADLVDKLSVIDEFLYRPDVFLMGDTQLWFGLRKLGKIHYLDEKTAVYRKHEGSFTMQSSFKRYIRFSLSSWELNYYLSYNHNFSEQQKELSSRELRRYLAIYRLLVPDYYSKIAEVVKLPETNKHKYVYFVQEYWSFLKTRISSFLSKKGIIK